MRKAQKKLTEDYLKLLNQAHDGIQKALKFGNISAAKDLLEQCQEIAVKAGELIEQTEGENHSAVLCLEEYCEVVYQFYERIRQGDLPDANKAHKSLRRVLIQIENKIKNEIKVRIEAVFLPYKASMWDSLESVWKAAVEDTDCDAYVIPIPYYDKNPDGSFGKEHYEGELYPDYVPITRYDAYDFAMRRPELIVIHNPYDECNYVTSVHPLFYARELKRYTDGLIYIPYFILEEPNPKDKESIKGIEHFCTVPGVIHADKVIVQSENMQRIYVDVMTKYAGRDTRKYWENKILGLGSPKTDKVLETKKEEAEIPKEWMEIIRKPSGEQKKIILYNTSVSALLEHGEDMIDKIQRVLQIFKENIEEAALLWRPHPLIQATIESMRPMLWGKYQDVVEGYKAEGWGIYDDSAELNRAIALSDGYYGDSSSLIQLCKSSGIPIMIQNIEV